MPDAITEVAPAPRATSSPRFFGALESLRGIAALSVALHHVGWKSPVTHCGYLWNAYLMVDFFFILSGFVICHSYADKIVDARGLGRFAWLRLGRLYPLHLLMLLVFLGLELIKYIAERKYGFVAYQSAAFSLNNGSAFLTNLLLIHAFGFTRETTFNGPSWSIGLEFYMYLLFGLVVLIFRNPKRISMAMVALCLAGIVLLNSFQGHSLNAFTGFAFFRCVIGFSLGVLTYRAYLKYEKSIARWNEPAVLVFVAGLLVFLSVKTEGPSDYLVLPAFVILILAVAGAPQSRLARGLNLRPLRWLGRISYSIYMVHLAVVVVVARIVAFLARKLSSHSAPAASGKLDAESILGLVFVLFTVAAVLVLSHFTYKWVELRYQDRSKQLAVRWFGPPERRMRS